MYMDNLWYLTYIGIWWRIIRPWGNLEKFYEEIKKNDIFNEYSNMKTFLINNKAEHKFWSANLYNTSSIINKVISIKKWHTIN